MTDLTVGALTVAVTAWPDIEAVPPLLRAVADTRLDDALAARSLPDGEWCLRRLDLGVRLDPTRPPSALATAWADHIADALVVALATRPREVVHYERPEAAVDDMLTGLATGRFDRAWAWRQVGVLGAGDPEPSAGTGRDLALRLFYRQPHGPAAALVRLVGQVGAAAVHRLVGPAGWQAAAVAVLEADGLTSAFLSRVAGSPSAAAPAGLAAPGGRPTPAEPRTRPNERRHEAPASGVAASSTVLRRAQRLAAGSILAVAVRRSGLRPDDETLVA